MFNFSHWNLCCSMLIVVMSLKRVSPTNNVYKLNTIQSILLKNRPIMLLQISHSLISLPLLDFYFSVQLLSWSSISVIIYICCYYYKLFSNLCRNKIKWSRNKSITWHQSLVEIKTYKRGRDRRNRDNYFFIHC